MFRTARLVVAIAAFGLLLGAAPAHAEDCVEVLQYKHCVPV